jgi:hypothetical protein
MAERARRRRDTLHAVTRCDPRGSGRQSKSGCRSASAGAPILRQVWPAFQLDSPAGGANAQTKSCTRHIPALAIGQAHLNYLFGPICSPHKLCPKYIGLLPVALGATA